MGGQPARDLGALVRQALGRDVRRAAGVKVLRPASAAEVDPRPSEVGIAPAPPVTRRRWWSLYWLIDKYAFERQDAGGWTDVTVEEGFKLLPHTIAPGGRMQQWAEIPPAATPGTCRIAEEIFPAGSERGTVVTGEIAVK